MDAILKFQNGAVMPVVLPRDGSTPIGDSYRLDTPEGALFMFRLVDRPPRGPLVYEEWGTPMEIKN